MSVSVSVRMSGYTPGFVIAATVAPERIEALNRVLAERLSDELKDHFTARNAEPNKMGGAKTNFWNEVAKSTGVTSVTAAGAVVSVAEQRFRIHFYGGTIRPKTAQFLTIPLIPGARGKFARDYERTTGRKLFSLPGVNVLFEKNKDTPDRSLVGAEKARTRIKGVRKSIGLRARTPLRAVYALAKSSTISKDPDAIPTVDKLAAALTQEAEDFLAREKRRGGVA